MDPVIARHLHYLEMDGKRPTTVQYRRNFLLRTERQLGRPLLEVSEDILLAWRSELSYCSDGTISSYLAHLRQFYDWTVGAELIERSPAARLPGPRKPQRIPRPVGLGDLLRSVELAPQPVRLMLVLAAWCGLRACEIAYLRVARITMDGQFPSILVAADATKGYIEHVVPLCPFVIMEIELFGLPRAGLVFRRLDGGRGPNTPTRISQLTNGFLHEIGVTATLHMYRHWYGTEFYEASSFDLRATQDVMGHADPRTTALYTKVRAPRAAAAAARLPTPPLLRAVS